MYIGSLCNPTSAPRGSYPLYDLVPANIKSWERTGTLAVSHRSSVSDVSYSRVASCQTYALDPFSPGGFRFVFSSIHVFSNICGNRPFLLDLGCGVGSRLQPSHYGRTNTVAARGGRLFHRPQEW